MDLSEKVILVTGGTGFIGSFIVEKLINRGCYVNVISHPKDSVWRIVNLNNLKICKIDLQNKSKVESYIKKIQPDLIFHLAAYVNPERDLKNIQKFYSINLNSTQNLLNALNDYEFELFINTGSADEYGKIQAPFKEGDREYPISPYSSSKLAATHFCEMIAQTYGKPIITIRPFLPYGPKQISIALIPSLIFSAINKIQLKLTPCEQTRDFIYIEDVAYAYISLAENAATVNKMGIFNLGTGKATPIVEIVDLIKTHFNETDFLIGGKPYREEEVMHSFSSIMKIENAVGWTPEWELLSGINETIKWWKNNKHIWMRYNKFFLKKKI